MMNCDMEKPLWTLFLGWAGFVSGGAVRAFSNGKLMDRVLKSLDRIEGKLDNHLNTSSECRNKCKSKSTGGRHGNNDS